MMFFVEACASSQLTPCNQLHNETRFCMPLYATPTQKKLCARTLKLNSLANQLVMSNSSLSYLVEEMGTLIESMSIFRVVVHYSAYWENACRIYKD